MLDITKVPSPCYVMEEDLLRKNLSLIKSVADRAGVEIIMAFKAFAMWKSFPIFREYIRYTTASSEYEARLAFEEFGSKAHTYSPAYTPQNFPAFLKYHLQFTFAVRTFLPGDKNLFRAYFLWHTHKSGIFRGGSGTV